MSTFSFFPWLWLGEPVATAAFTLVPYRREMAQGPPRSKLQRWLDSVTRAYHQTPKVPVEHAVVMQVAGKQIGDELTDEEITTALLVLIVPGPYSDRQLAFQAASIAGAVAFNAAFNCNTPGCW